VALFRVPLAEHRLVTRLAAHWEAAAGATLGFEIGAFEKLFGVKSRPNLGWTESNQLKTSYVCDRRVTVGGQIYLPRLIGIGNWRRIRDAWGQPVLQSEEYLQFLSHNVEGGSINNAEIAGEAGGMDSCQLMQAQCG
jgi:hypothetical protein